MTEDWFIVYGQDSRGQDSHGRAYATAGGSHGQSPQDTTHHATVTGHIRALRKRGGS